MICVSTDLFLPILLILLIKLLTTCWKSYKGDKQINILKKHFSMKVLQLKAPIGKLSKTIFRNLPNENSVLIIKKDIDPLFALSANMYFRPEINRSDISL